MGNFWMKTASPLKGALLYITGLCTMSSFLQKKFDTVLTLCNIEIHLLFVAYNNYKVLLKLFGNLGSQKAAQQ